MTIGERPSMALRLPTWDDVARSIAWHITGREITYQEAGYVLWNETCFGFGSRQQVEDQLVALYEAEHLPEVP